MDLVKANKNANEPVQLAIPVAATSTLLDKLESEKIDDVVTVITVSKDFLKSNDQAVISEIHADKELLEVVKESGKEMKVEVADRYGKVWYTWIIDGEQMNNSLQAVTSVNLAVQMDSSSSADKIGELVKKDKNNDQGYVLTMNVGNAIPSGSVLKINVKEQLGFETGKEVYLYHYNTTTNTLDSTVKVKYTVDKEGYISTNLKYGDEYVILEHAADTSVKRTLSQQIQVSNSKLTIKKGKTQILSVSLPEVIVAAPSFSASETSKYGSETLLAKITYKVSNTSIATIDQNGKISAKKAGKVTVTTTVLLENGTKKTFKVAITVKK
jgi:hypothetical protein